MTITTRRVRGIIVLPDGTVPRNGRVTYQLSGWDREDGEAVVMGPITVTLDDDGVFDDYLWCTDTGDNGRVYLGVVAWHDGTARRELPIRFDVQSGVGTQPFVPSWVVGDLPESTQADALAQCLAAAAGASADAVDAAASADDAIAAAASAAASAAAAGVDIGRAEMVAMISGGTVPQDGARYSLDGWIYIGATGATALPGLPGMLPMHPVTPFHFGATGNYVADDRAAFAAMDAYGGAVYIPKPPTGYKFSTPITLANVSVEIDGTVTYAALTDGGKLQYIYNQFRDDGFVQITRVPGRVFLGGMVDHSGNRRGVNGYGTDPVSLQMGSWLVKAAATAACSEDPRGRIGFLGSAWCQPGLDAAICCGVAGIARHDGISSMARGGYFEVIAARSVLDGASADAACELQVGNRTGVTPKVSPYNTQNAIVTGLQVSAASQEGYTIGDADTPVPPATNRAGAGILFTGTGSDPRIWTAGVVFTTGSLYRDGGGFSDAVMMAQKHKLRWDATAFNEGASIWSQVTDPTKKVAMAFANNAVLFLGESGQTTASITSAAAGVNYLDFAGGVAGGPVSVRALGSDADISLKLLPKGGGYVQFGAFTSVGSGTVNGYITIKDATGAVRKLATIA